ncbi:hypothetical protein [Lentibacillus sp. CBA3610]|uniref:hypothetical protein n=1 Tax=Lentibacillus sp. CBA3610 TaxID=2518176 RepID=UPI00159617A2|nr:hypothetical protein [Lentibacillus sp. CBA3610]QKY69324.1 hypothetical protein Len3610_06655 [Lentibacillus sp. CBA3610]
MKKLFISILAGAFIIGGTGTLAFANAGGEEGNGPFNFGQMKPYIEEMHPDLSTQQQKEMFDNCHGEDGYMQNFNNQGMMSDF